MFVLLIGAIVGVVFVLPVVVILLGRVLKPVMSIRSSARSILKDGVTITGDLDPVPELLTTQSLVGSVTGNAVRYVTAIDPLIP